MNKNQFLPSPSTIPEQCDEKHAQIFDFYRRRVKYQDSLETVTVPQVLSGIKPPVSERISPFPW